jgi:hypothetical protein
MWPLLGVPTANVVDGVGNDNSVEALLIVTEISGDVWVPFSSASEAISSIRNLKL